MSIIPEFGRQKDWKFEVSMGYIARLWTQRNKQTNKKIGKKAFIY
jgi:hypothetical protein